MKKYVLLAVMFVGLLVSSSSIAKPGTETRTENPPTPKLELNVHPPTTTSSYSPLWIVDKEAKHKMQKFIWVPSKDGHVVVLDASNAAILRLAWNLDTYQHGTKTKTN